MDTPNDNNLTVKDVYEKAKEDANLKAYLPDYKGDQLPNKKFLFNIINTIYPGRMVKMIKEVRALKKDVKEAKKLNYLVMTPDYYNILSNFKPVYEPPPRHNRKFLGLIR